MADDIRDGLKKVLASQGKKKFFFAYGVGKRKDKKGEGELAVSGKKPKKADIDAELADAGDFYEGICWVGTESENSQTVYFQGKGKKLAPTILTKMVKTAKSTAGKQYDFQMPSAEEEARADKLTEGDGEEEPAVAPPAPAKATVPPAPSKPPAAPVAKTPPPAQKPAPKAAPEATLEKEWERLMIAAEPKVKKAEKAKEGAAKQSRKIFESSANLGSEGKFAEAIAELKKLETLLNPEFAKAKEEYEAAAGVARALMAQLNAEDGSAVRDYLDDAKAALDKPKTTVPDFTDAATKLDELKATLQAELPSVYQEATSKIPAPSAAVPPSEPDAALAAPKSALVGLRKCRLEWVAAVQKIHAELSKLKQATRQTYQADDRLPLIEAAIDNVVANLQRQNESLTDKLDEALNAGEAAKRHQLHQEARELVLRLQAYANSDPILQEIDANGIVPLEIKKTLTSVLPALAAKLAG